MANPSKRSKAHATATPSPQGRRDAGRPRGTPILDAVLTRTLEELAAHGIEGASVDRIARAAEVNKTSVYRRWPTKESLIAAALERVAVDIGARIEDRGSLAAELLLLAEQVAALLESPIGRSLARAALSESVGGELAALAAREIERPRASIVAMRARARERGEWREGVSVEAALASLVGALMHRALLERAPLTRPLIREVAALITRGLRPDAAPNA